MSVTPSPTSTTLPAASCPRISGGGSAIVPFVAERSEWQTPHAAIFTMTSPRLGESIVISSTTTGLFNSRQITALAWRAIALLRKTGTGAKYSGSKRPFARLAHLARHARLRRLAGCRHLARQLERHADDDQHRRDQRNPKPDFLLVDFPGVIARCLDSGRLDDLARAHFADPCRERRDRLVRCVTGHDCVDGQHGRDDLPIAELRAERRFAARDEHQSVRQISGMQHRHAASEAAPARIDSQDPARFSSQRNLEIRIDEFLAAMLHAIENRRRDGALRCPDAWLRHEMRK